jgi:hypothetical protein
VAIGIEHGWPAETAIAAIFLVAAVLGVGAASAGRRVAD